MWGCEGSSHDGQPGLFIGLPWLLCYYDWGGVVVNYMVRSESPVLSHPAAHYSGNQSLSDLQTPHRWVVGGQF